MDNRFCIVDNRSPNVVSRSRSLRICYSGYRLTDSLFTTANGQRELLIGDRQVGKSSLGLGFVLSQSSHLSSLWRFRSVIAIVTVVSSKCSTVVRLYEVLSKCSYIRYVVIV